MQVPISAINLQKWVALSGDLMLQSHVDLEVVDPIEDFPAKRARRLTTVDLFVERQRHAVNELLGTHVAHVLLLAVSVTLGLGTLRARTGVAASKRPPRPAEAGAEAGGDRRAPTEKSTAVRRTLSPHCVQQTSTHVLRLDKQNQDS